MQGHIDSGQDDDDDDGDEEDDHENEVLISVKVTSANDDIVVQDEENLTSDEMFPHKDGERYTQHLHVSTKGLEKQFKQQHNLKLKVIHSVYYM